MNLWWQNEAIYQIYPRSFQDSNGDGVGDLQGIRKRLPYIAQLGAGAVWLSPIFRSPMKDFGYDIADYCDIDPLFGSMDDFEQLLEEAHSHGLRLLLDFVPNHTSDQHAWFKQSRSSRDNDRRDWYIWQDPGPDGGPPNNWMSNFGGSAWTLDRQTGQYYYHAFLSSQPDLNWRNPQVRKAMLDTLRFWLDKGVDGFRVDVIWHLIKDAQLRDNPPNPDYKPGKPDIQRYQQVYSADQPEVHDVIAEMRSVIDDYPERLLIGEIYLPLERLMKYYGQSGEGVHLPFNFQLLQAPWEAERLASLIDEYEAALPEEGWPNWVLSNHDQPRIAARVGEAQTRVAAMLLLTLRGTPTLYYGDELGIGRVTIPEDRIQDPWAKQEPDSSFNRDAARTPMQWSARANAGFSPVEPWLPLTGDWSKRNVDTVSSQTTSLLNLYQSLLVLRKRESALRIGSYHLRFATDRVLCYERIHDDERLAVLLNFTDGPCEVALPAGYGHAELLLSTALTKQKSVQGNVCHLQANEGLIVRAVARENGA